VNLGWKLAQVGIIAESLLDTHHAERHPVGARVLRNDRAQTALDRNDGRTLHQARPVLLNVGEPGAFDIAPWNGPRPARRCAIHENVGAAGASRGHPPESGADSSRGTHRVGRRRYGRGAS
jgi:hypothetical protein